MINTNELQKLYGKWLSLKEKKEHLSEYLITTAENKLPDYKKDNMTLIAVNLNNLDQMTKSMGCINKSKKIIPNQVYFEFNSDVE